MGADDARKPGIRTGHTAEDRLMTYGVAVYINLHG